MMLHSQDAHKLLHHQEFKGRFAWCLPTFIHTELHTDASTQNYGPFIDIAQL